MAELIPALNSIKGKMETGERRLAERLASLLEDDYLCWFDIPVGKQRRYSDFMVLHPQRGLLFLEVKDWRINNIQRISVKDVDLLTSDGLKTLANPLEQARQCSYTVVNKLSQDPQLCQQGDYQGKLCFPYGYGVVLPFITRKQLNTAIPLPEQETLLPPHLLICSDEMTENSDPEVFQKRLWDMFNYQFGAPLTLPQIDRIRWHLYPEIRIDKSQQADLFACDNTAQDSLSLSEAIPDIVKIMDLQQEQLARSLGEGHRVIHGVAGSGKTLILGYRCLHLAELLHKPILVLCYNITLAASLRSFISAKGIADKVQVYHFHDWCSQQLKTYHAPLIGDESEAYFDRSVASVIAGVEANQIPQGQYGALLIDEGHDFEAEWLTLITKMVDPDTNSLLLLYDDAQSIYKKKSKLNFSLSSVGIQAQGRTTILRLNYRNTREILQFAYHFARKYFSASNEEIPLIEPEGAGSCGEVPVIRKFPNLKDELDFVLKCLRHWQQKGKSLKDIAVVYPSGATGKKMAQRLKNENIPHQWLGAPEFKKKYDPNANKVTLLPIHSSKGLEFETVVMLDSSYLSQKADDESEAARLMYVGFTRATTHLLATYHRDTVLAEGLEETVSQMAG